MTTLEQAARQALETLERASDAGYSVECDETITALREALEQAAPKAAPTWPSEALVWEALQAYLKHDTNMEGMRAALIVGAAQEEMDKEASNARLDIDSNSTEPEQQRDVACSLEVGQHVGNGEHQEASCKGSKDSELLKIAARNLKYFIEHAQFSSFADKRAALNCLDALAAPQQEAQEPVATLHCDDIGYVWAWVTEVGTRMRFEQPINLYTAPQPAPAPLSDEREAFESTWEKLHGKKPVLWDTAFKEAKMDVPAHSAGKYFYRDAQAAWKAWQARAALAAQGGKDA